MPKLINWNIARNPVNWAIVLLMVVIGGFVADIVLRWWKQSQQPTA
jgi:hypothetical protein